MLRTRDSRSVAEGARWLPALAFLAVATAAAGQSGVWSTRGPFGGNVYCVVADPSHPFTLYAGTAQGVFKSEDAGSTWKSSSAGMPAVRVQTIAVDPTASSTLYAGTLTPSGVASVGVFKSTDGGASWAPANAGLIDPLTGTEPIDVAALAIDPRNSGTILAGTRFSEIFKSTDGGATWQPRTLGGFDVSLQTWNFQFNPSNPSTIYAASTLGLLRSTNGGDSWGTFGNAGVPFFALAVDPTSATTLYAGDSNGSGMWKSIDGGAHWSTINTSLPVLHDSVGSYSPLVIALAVDPARPMNLYAATYGNGIFQSENGGSSWTAVDNGLRNSYAVALALTQGSSSTIYTGTLGGGLYRSADGGGTWTPSNTGLNASLISAVVVDPGAPDTIWAATSDGVQKSTDGGSSWQAAVNGLPVSPVAALALLPGSPERLYAGTLGGGLFKSSDGGMSWSSGAASLNDSFVASIAVDPSAPSTLYAGTAHPYTGSNSERVFKSTDGGVSWTQTSLDAQGFSVNFIAVNPKNSSQVVAGSQGVVGYFQSLDAGKTWSTVASNTSCGGISQLLFDSSGSTLLLAGTAGVCRSTDGGKTWALTAVGGSVSVNALLFDGSNPPILYAGTSPDSVTGTGVFRSADAGQTWQPVGSGLSPLPVTALAIDALGKTLHAGTRGGGVAELVFPRDRQPVQTPPAQGRGTRALSPR